MLVIEYLKEYGLEKLKEEFSIKVKEYPDRIVLNYDQISSPRFIPLVEECRGLILSIPDFTILNRTFDRFYNINERKNQHHLDLKEYIGFEKIDGNLLSIYNDGVNWNCATRGMAFAEGNSHYNTEVTFKNIFELSIGDTLENFCIQRNPDFTYIFELVSPFTRVVKPYPYHDLYLLAVRNKYTGEYIKDLTSISIELGVKLPKIYKFTTIGECILASTKLESSFDEGFVIWNPENGHRIKIKSPSYLSISHLRGNGVINEKRIINLVFANEYHEYLSMFPEDQKFFDPFIDKLDNLKKSIKEMWELTKDITDQKEFALKIQDLKYKSILFQMRKENLLNDIINNLSKNIKINLLNDIINNLSENIKINLLKGD